MNHSVAQFGNLFCSSQALQRTPESSVGSFKLWPKSAVTLNNQAPGELRITHGCVWLTFVDAAQDASVRAGDHFLQVGDRLHLARGQQVVMEAFDAPPSASINSSVYFNWEPDAPLSVAASSGQVQHAHAEVRQSLLDLGAALHQAGWALGRLVHGLGAALTGAFVMRRRRAC